MLQTEPNTLYTLQLRDNSILFRLVKNSDIYQLPWTCGAISHLCPQPAHKFIVCLWLTYSSWSKCCLLNLLQARATTEWPNDKVVLIASIQPVRNKWGTTTSNQSSIAVSITGSLSACGKLAESPISPSSG